MSNIYNKKISVYKHKIDIQVYKFPIITYEKETKKEPKVKRARKNKKILDEAEIKHRKERRKTYYIRKINQSIDLAVHNDLTTHIVLTFAADIYDYKSAQHEWDLFLKRLKYQIRKCNKTELKYLCTHELHKKRNGITSDGTPYNGVWHFHCLCDLGFYPIEKLTKIWSKGHVYISQIKSTGNKKNNDIRYIFKYIIKDILEDTETISGRKIYTSRNLDKPIVKKDYTMETLEDIIIDYMDDISKHYSYEIITEAGLVNKVDVIQIKRE